MSEHSGGTERPHEPPTGDYSGYYYRGGQGADPEAAARLKALADGYFALNWVFLANVILFFGLRVGAALVFDQFDAPEGVLFVALVLFPIIAILTYFPNRKITRGKGAGTGLAELASVLMGLNAALCCGIVGYVVMQQIASVEMKKYGVRTGFLGIRKKDVNARIAELQGAAPSFRP